MNDKSIRSILISYLQAKNREIRIYQEKSIGSAVCDLMTVTDLLTGYEIKSDEDNYQRLNAQVDAYSQFFDRNYIVVGASHARSAQEKVPAEWGIIVIQDDSVTIKRKAQKGSASCRRQLEILWRLELTNLLTKANLPLYTYKSKAYIIRQICEHLEESEIKAHVVYELMHRDYSVYQAKDHSLYFNAAESEEDEPPPPVENLPIAEIVDALSEQSADEMTLDQWIALYTKARELRKSKETVSVRQNTQSVPHTIPYTDIEVSLGVPWVSAGIIGEFACFLRTGREMHEISDKIPGGTWLNYEPLTGHWFISDKRCTWKPADKVRVGSTYGTQDYNAMYILEATLNLQQIKRDSEEKTLAALEKQESIVKLFKSWIWEDEDRRWEVEEAYNKLFADFTPTKYSGKELVFPEMSDEIRLFDYQKDAVMRIISEKNTLLAFDVGAGKTYIMIAAAMQMRQEGISRKNLFVVPNNIVGQWELIFKKMYPAAKILSVAPDSFKPQMRGKVLGQIQKGDYDGIIMAYSCFELIPLSQEHLMDALRKNLAEMDEALRKSRYATGAESALNREKERYKKQLRDLIDAWNGKSTAIAFDELEINTLFVDEAHNFKNIPIYSAMKNIAGVNLKGSRKCSQMLHKVRSVQEDVNGRGVVLATGTPLCNSISDAYTMQMYLQYDVLKEAHLDRFDNWVKSFAEPQTVYEIDVDTSKYRQVRRFARFFNLPELSRMFSSIAAFYSMNLKDDLPILEGYSDITIARNENLQGYMNELCERTEVIRAGDISRKKDNMLKVSTDGRKAALDLRLVGREQPYDETAKLFWCVKQVMQIYSESPGCSQIVFCDYSTPKKSKFNIYSELREHFILCGVPAKEIAFIHSFHSEASKSRLFEKVNRGEVRILIGSTFKLGIGANVQTRLKAIHHLDVPWRPADMVQREGRILRQGNQNKQVAIYRYIAEGSFDSYSWQLLETKQRFISQFLSGTEYQRSASDLEENVLTYAQVKALAISEPMMKMLAEKENELRRLRLLATNYVNSKESREKAISERNRQVEELKTRLAKTIENVAYAESISEDDFTKEYQRLSPLLTAQTVLGAAKSSEELGFLEFCIKIPEEKIQNENKPFVYLERNDVKYRIYTGKSAAGNAKRVANFIKRFHREPQAIEENIHKHTDEIAELKTMNESPNPYLQEIQTCESELAKLRAKLQL